MAIIEAKKICKTYYTDHVATPVLHDMNFEIEEGEPINIYWLFNCRCMLLIWVVNVLKEMNRANSNCITFLLRHNLQILLKPKTHQGKGGGG